MRKMQTNCDLIECCPLPILPGSALEHSQSDTVGHEGQSRGARRVAFEPNGIPHQRAYCANGTGWFAKLSGNTLGKRNSGDTTRLCTVYLAMLPSRELILQYESWQLSRFTTRDR